MQTKLNYLPSWSTETAQIPLSHGLFALIDATDFFELAKYHWTTRRSHSIIYAIRKTHIAGKSCTIFMHRQILQASQYEHIHHLNHNTLDNRRSNLEPLSPTLHRIQHSLDRITRKNRADTG